MDNLPRDKKIRFQIVNWAPHMPHTARLKTENPTAEVQDQYQTATASRLLWVELLW